MKGKKSHIKGREIVVEMVCGSHLYKLNTPKSDTDYGGVYFPTSQEILTNKILPFIEVSRGPTHEKNTSNDVDSIFYSLPYFMDKLLKGDTGAMDMLHGRSDDWLFARRSWRTLVDNKHRFYSKSMSAFFGYVKKQAAKYGVKGSRIQESKEVLNFLEGVDSSLRIIDVWDDLWEGEHCHKIGKGNDRMWVCCGKKMTALTKASHYIYMMGKFVERYGHRAKQAELNEGVDWKAVSHALRVGYQMKSIFMYGDYIYPLPQSVFIKDVKEGTLHYLNDVAPVLEDLVDEVTVLAKASDLPEKPDYEWAMKYLASEMLGVLERDYASL